MDQGADVVFAAGGKIAASEDYIRIDGKDVTETELYRDLYKRYLNPTASHVTQKFFGRMGVAFIDGAQQHVMSGTLGLLPDCLSRWIVRQRGVMRRRRKTRWQRGDPC